MLFQKLESWSATSKLFPFHLTIKSQLKSKFFQYFVIYIFTYLPLLQSYATTSVLFSWQLIPSLNITLNNYRFITHFCPWISCWTFIYKNILKCAFIKLEISSYLSICKKLLETHYNK